MSLTYAALAATMVALVMWPSAGMAYFGPGAGITMLGAVWGVVLAIAFALFALLAWPIRAVLRKRRRAAAGAASGAGKTDAGT